MKKLLIRGAFCAASLAVLLGLLLYNGTIWFQNPWPERYPVRGVDVSAHQGDID